MYFKAGQASSKIGEANMGQGKKRLTGRRVGKKNGSRQTYATFLGVDLNEECFSAFFGNFPKFRYFPIYRKKTKNNENVEKKLKNSPS